MSSDNSNSNQTNNDMAPQQRRGSVTASSAALASLFRSNSVSQGQPTNFPGTSAAINEQRRRLSITTLGLSGTSPSASFMRRASLSTNNSELAEENAIDEDDGARTAPAVPFGRRMSLGGARGPRGGVSPGTNGRPSPPDRSDSTSLRGPPPTPPPVTTPGTGNYTWGRTPSQANIATPLKTPSDLISPRSEQGFNWSEQLRSRAESTVSGQRPSFSFASGLSGSPPGAGFRRPSPPAAAPQHDRAKSISEMPAPPAQAPKARPVPQKPDPFQERILKGDFYMD